MLIKNKKDETSNTRSVPIWFMRQAGRYLPEYHILRNKETSFLKTCFNSDLAAQISIQPITRFNFDFIILFADILVIPHALGQKVDFVNGVGPILDEFDLNKKYPDSNNNALKKLSPIFDTLRIIKSKSLPQKTIGFCGGPFTVLTYMIERGSSRDHKKTLHFLKNKPTQSKYWIKRITSISIEYLLEQIKAGADLIKVFDSWAGLLDEKEYEEYIIKPNKEIFETIKKATTKTKVILFPRKSKNYIDTFLREINCDIISIDQHLSDKNIYFCKKKDITIQGNLKPELLLEGGIKMVEEVKKIMEKYKNNKHIFNLSHGVLPNTPLENVKQVVEQVQNYEYTK